MTSTRGFYARNRRSDKGACARAAGGTIPLFSIFSKLLFPIRRRTGRSLESADQHGNEQQHTPPLRPGTPRSERVDRPAAGGGGPAVPPRAGVGPGVREHAGEARGAV